MLKKLLRPRSNSKTEYATYCAQYTYGPSGDIFTGDSVLRYPDYLYHRDIQNHLTMLAELNLPGDEMEVKAYVQPLTRAATVRQILTRAPGFLTDNLESMTLERRRQKCTAQVTFLENLTWWVAHEKLPKEEFSEIFALEPQVQVRATRVLRQLVAGIEMALRRGDYTHSPNLTISEVERLNTYLQSLPHEESRRVAAIVNLYGDLFAWHMTYVVTNLPDIRKRLLRLKMYFVQSGISPETALPDPEIRRAYLELSAGLA